MNTNIIEKMVRLLEILLANKNGVPLNSLCERLEISRRTVYRLRDSILEVYRIKIEIVPDPDGNTNAKKWRLKDMDFRSGNRPLPVNDATWLAMQMALGSGSLIKNPNEARQLSDAIIRSSFLTDTRGPARAIIKHSGAKDYSDKAGILERLSRAMRENLRVKIEYHSPWADEGKTYEIEPYTLVEHQGILYLLCAVPKHDGNIIRIAIDRIISISLSRTKFFILPSFKPEEHLEGAFGISVEKPIRVRVQLFDDAALYARDRVWGNKQTVKEMEDGSVLLTFTASGIYEIRNWVLSHGARAIVKGPASLVKLVEAEHREIAKRYH